MSIDQGPRWIHPARAKSKKLMDKRRPLTHCNPNLNGLCPPSWSEWKAARQSGRASPWTVQKPEVTFRAETSRLSNIEASINKFNCLTKANKKNKNSRPLRFKTPRRGVLAIITKKNHRFNHGPSPFTFPASKQRFGTHSKPCHLDAHLAVSEGASPTVSALHCQTC